MRTHNLMLCQQENPPLRALRMSMPMSRRIYASAACGGTRGPAPRCGGGTGLWWRGPGRGTCPAARRAGRQAPSRAAHRAADR